MSKVTFTFVGHNADKISERFYSWAVDGGLEDEIIDMLSDDDTEVQGITDYNSDTQDIEINSLPNE